MRIRLEWGNGPFLQADLSVLRSLLASALAHHGPADDAFEFVRTARKEPRSFVVALSMQR